MAKFRFHRSSLEESLLTTVNVNTLTQLRKQIAAQYYLPGTEHLYAYDRVEFTALGPIGTELIAAGHWETHLVTLNGDAIGFIDGVVVDEPVKLKEPKLDMSEWRKLVASTKKLVMGGRTFTHYFNENGAAIATGLGEGPYHMELFIFDHIEELTVYHRAKAIQDEAERFEREAAKLAKMNSRV